MPARLALACALLLGLGGCGDDNGRTPPEPEPVPGQLLVRLISPNGGEGAALLETSDTGIVDAVALGGELFLGRSGPTSRLLVILDQPDAVRVTITVEDVNAPPRFEIVEVADPENRLRAPLSGYSVTVEPLGGT